MTKAADSGASWRDRLGVRLRLVMGQFAKRLRLPGLIADMECIDPGTGRRLRVRVGELFTCLTIDGHDYYFRRWSGLLDGGGTGC